MKVSTKVRRQPESHGSLKVKTQIRAGMLAANHNPAVR
jgi:hypothetical protein